MSVKYILIDFENVQPKNGELSALNNIKGDFRLFVFVGAKQKLSVDMVMALQPLGEKVTYVDIVASGKNALDFHIAYYLGCLSCKDPKGVFYVISADQGYAPLIKHMQTVVNVKVEQKTAIEKVPLVANVLKKANIVTLAKIESMPMVDETTKKRVDTVKAILIKMGKSRPRAIKTLASTIKASFKNENLSDKKVGDIIEVLKTNKIIIVTDESKVSYNIKSA